MILVCDYDRTLRIDDAISQRNREAIDTFKKEGHIFVVNSGRTHQHLQVELDNKNLQCDYTITGSGSQVRDSKGNILVNIIMKSDHVKMILDEIFKANSISLQVCCMDLWIHKLRVNESVWDHSILEYDPEKVNAISTRFATHEEADLFSERLNATGLISAYSNGFNVDMTSKHVSKATGISDLAKYLESNHEIHVIGDSYNDYDMIKAYNGYCVAVSDPRIVEVASRQFEDVASCIDWILKK